jgi:glutaredoxin
VRLTIYSKPGCHLCDDMKDLVRTVIADEPEVTLEEIDISSDPELLERYGLEIPVLMIDGRKAAKYRVAREDLKRMIEGRQSRP